MSADTAASASDGPGPMTRRAWRALSLSQTGASHERRGTCCEDRSQAGVAQADTPWSDRGRGDWAYVVVADGHGSDNSFRSDRGAQFAVDVLARAFGEVRRAVLEPDDGQVRETPAATWKDAVPRYVVAGWRAAVYRDLLADPPTLDADEPGLSRFLTRVLERHDHPTLEQTYVQLRTFERHAAEARAAIAPDTPLPPVSGPDWDADAWGAWQAKAYGATLLGVLIGPDALHWLQLGDGAMVQISGGEARYLEPPPSEALANETPSLSADDAVLSIRTGTVPFVKGHVPSAVILTTDGLPNSYDQLDGFFSFCTDIAREASNPARLEQQLPGWLAKISAAGSGDDMSLAMAWATETSTRHGRTTANRDHAPEADHREQEEQEQDQEQEQEQGDDEEEPQAPQRPQEERPDVDDENADPDGEDGGAPAGNADADQKAATKKEHWLRRMRRGE